MAKVTQKNYEAITIYRLKEKIFKLKSLLSYCVDTLEDALEEATEEDEVLFYKDLLNDIYQELNTKRKNKK